jgi:UDP-N-acetylmuramyl tripeptide synthase
MNNLRDILTIWLCKTIYKVMRIRGSHGAALPGLVAEKINPGLINKLTKLPEGIIVVSGTNGKTTTTYLLAKALQQMGKKVFTNHSGSNMTRGLLASIVRFSSARGTLDYDIAVLEIDEAYAAKLAPLLKPRAAILTNVLRDQLDRFGEIDHTARLLFKFAESCREAVIYSASDSRLRSIPDAKMSARAVSYGFDGELVSHFPDDDSLYSAQKRSLPDKLDYMLKSADETRCEIATISGPVRLDRARLPGWHNVLNLTAVYALISELYGPQDPQLFEGLRPPYGRGEVISIGDTQLTLQLVKNPSGFRTAMDVEPDSPALIVINDNIADGRDVSWLWDVDVDSIGLRKSVATSGSRAYDMAVRLHYSDIEPVFVEPNIRLALERFISENKSGVIFLTYTSMLQSRKIIKSIKKGVSI